MFQPWQRQRLVQRCIKWWVRGGRHTVNAIGFVLILTASLGSLWILLG
ncbi:hypothetical protein HY375_02815 [Candidatus Berkelbacteria bacterium]|nr:hypothetical protein [Candidatus Berkelbacteria bacterium]